MCGPVSRRRRWATAVTAFSPPRSTGSNSGPLISAVSTSSRPRRVRASRCGSRDSAVTFAALCGVSPVEASSGKPSAAGSTEAVTGKPTARSTPSSWPASAADVRERISRAPVAGWHPFINRRAASLPSSSSTAPSTRPTVDRPVPIHTSTASPSVRSRWSTASPLAPSSTTVSAAGTSTTEHPACSRSRYSTCSSAVILVSHATGRPPFPVTPSAGLVHLCVPASRSSPTMELLCPFLHFDHPPEPIDCTFRATT